MSSNISLFTRRMLNASKMKPRCNNIRIKRMSSDDHGPAKFGDNMPFNISCHRKLAAKVAFFCGSAIAYPFSVVHYHLTKGGSGDESADSKPGKGAKPAKG